MAIRMRIVAAKLTEDRDSIRLAYEKNGKLFVRSGADDFKVGTPLTISVDNLYKWGYRKIINPPQFIDAGDVLNNIDKFELKTDGSVVYSG
jgi:hypothetical protein